MGVKCGRVANKCQVAALESVMLGGEKRILGCSSKTCNEAVTVKPPKKRGFPLSEVLTKTHQKPNEKH